MAPLKLRQFKQPANLAGHKYAGALSLSGTGRMPSWKNAPFIGTASPGTKNRSRERVQAQIDRIQIMKAHYVQTKKKLQDQMQKAKTQQQVATSLRKNAQNAKAFAIGSKLQANRDKFRQKLNIVLKKEANIKEDQRETARMIKMFKTELIKIDKEITKITQRLAKNKALVKKRM